MLAAVVVGAATAAKAPDDGFTMPGTGVLPSGVILSKWVVFTTAATLQAILTTVTFVMNSGPRQSLFAPPTVELGIDLIAMSITAMSSGLLISVLARRLEQAVALATGTAIAQVALSGGLSTLDGNRLLQLLAWPLPARWGLGRRVLGRPDNHDGRGCVKNRQPVQEGHGPSQATRWATEMIKQILERVLCRCDQLAG